MAKDAINIDVTDTVNVIVESLDNRKTQYTPMEMGEDLLSTASLNYIAAKADNPASVLEDIRQVVASLTKEQYQEWQAARNKIFPPETVTDGKTNYKWINAVEFIRLNVAIMLYTLQYGSKIDEGYSATEADEHMEAAMEIIGSQAEKWYKRPKSTLPKQGRRISKEALESLLPTKDLAKYIESPVLNLAEYALDNPDKIDSKYRTRKHKYSRAAKIKTETNGDMRRITEKTMNGKAIKTLSVLRIENFSKIANGSPFNRKILRRLMAKIYEIVAEGENGKGVLIKNSVYLYYREFVGKGLYRDTSSAKRGVLGVVEAIKQLWVSGEVIDSKNRKQVQSQEAPLLKAMGKDTRERVELFPNDMINWNFVCPYLSWLPSFYEELSPHASVTLNVIFRQARQAELDDKETGKKKAPTGKITFTISNRWLWFEHGLPDLPKKDADGKTISGSDIATHPGQQIFKPIADSFEDIEEAYRRHSTTEEPEIVAIEVIKAPDGSEVSIEDYPGKLTAEKRLNDGYWRITLSGEYAEPFEQIAEKEQKQITKNTNASKRRKQRNADKQAAAVAQADANAAKAAEIIAKSVKGSRKKSESSNVKNT